MSELRSGSNAPDLGRYLERIGYDGSLEPSLETLRALQRAHLRAIPYENLDIHLGTPIGLGASRAFAKLVTARRGGWCFEMNGLFAWVLEMLGYRVRMVAGAVGRERVGEDAVGNHLVLLVDLGDLILTDVGFGDGPLEPLPLAEGGYRLGSFEFRIERSGEWWTLRNHEHGGAPSFEFTLEPRELGWFAAKCQELQTSPASGFVQKTICQRYAGDTILSLRGAVLRTIDGAGPSEHVVGSAAEYDAVLRERFGLSIPAVGRLWDLVWVRHLEWRRAVDAGGPSR